ncbi:hypothetical protein K0M31_001043, partial [Melipona bicolor]
KVPRLEDEVAVAGQREPLTPTTGDRRLRNIEENLAFTELRRLRKIELCEESCSSIFCPVLDQLFGFLTAMRFLHDASLCRLET